MKKNQVPTGHAFDQKYVTKTRPHDGNGDGRAGASRASRYPNPRQDLSIQIR